MTKRSDFSQKKLFNALDELAINRAKAGMNLVSEKDSKKAEKRALQIRRNNKGINSKHFRYLMLREELSLSQIQKFFPFDIIKDHRGNIKINDFNFDKIKLLTYQESAHLVLEDNLFVNFLVKIKKDNLINNLSKNPGITVCKNILGNWIKFQKQQINAYQQKLDNQKAKYQPRNSRKAQAESQKYKAIKLFQENKNNKEAVSQIANELGVTQRRVYQYLEGYFKK